ncbi:penicillin-binding transpeptidase domain-containing protein [Niabella beijingensis]|uniref:penicillin-binding transpeptidase domain-containing protein n=1 Tax=Niabella beijingensis TaxID=2872700 RepID=UPI001CC0114E|nr:penicillin-binding transpeptidase domain-containing protein [Niabella beijingensis]MBZ4190298.1 penicillin binding protein transpeptidase domain-containing protein [Niabella beijingensis]
MRTLFLFCFLFTAARAGCQTDVQQPFKACRVTGSTTLFDLKNNRWMISDSADAAKGTQPASTFKIINLLIALETRVINDENAIVKWPGHTDTTLYGYRPDIYRDMSVKEAFEVSAGWVFIELAKRIGREKYRYYLDKCDYGNGDLTEKDADFWNFGPFAITPKNQVAFLIKVYKEHQLPFSKRNLAILKKVMITEEKEQDTIRSKTGWTRIAGKNIGWWTGYVTTKDNVYFFATRILNDRADNNPDFGNCRKTITRYFLEQLEALHH